MLSKLKGYAAGIVMLLTTLFYALWQRSKANNLEEDVEELEKDKENYVESENKKKEISKEYSDKLEKEKENVEAGKRDYFER